MASPEHSHPSSAAEALESLGRLSLRQLSMESLLQTVADLATSVMPGDTESSVTLLIRDVPSTVVSTGRMALELDETQYECGAGPCVHAARTGRLTEITDTRTERRWPVYTRRATVRGNLSSLSVPLAIDDDERVTGALNLYARRPRAFDENSRCAAQGFGPYAAVAVGNLWAYQGVQNLAGNLHAALESRAVIDQAKGVLVERYKLTPDQAFQLLARTSMNLNRRLRDISDDLVRTGELPGAPPRGNGLSPRRIPARRGPAAEGPPSS